ncbi:transglutaminase TgpA family protein [Halomonas sp. NCCP-2165]|nr:DUF3488 and DUF4129 domain-containing transglutaminase family protein [Halomonas sp. NCCP-2165]GKW48580.1 protein-glutamine gamma-glutamyltransferase [Halomonas sp. NCCP-2165]
MSAAPVVLADGRSLSAAMLRQLFIGQCLVVALHLAWMPPWLLGVALAAAAWRYLQLRDRVPRASILLRLTAVVGVLAALWVEFGSLHGMDGLIGVLLGIYLLKLLETHNRRDARVVICIGFVAMTVAFLHDQGVLMTIGALLAAVWLLQSLVGLAGAAQPASRWRETLWLAGLSLPLMVVLFLGFPRLGPLWSMPQTERAATGLTEEIAPGDIAELSRSDARAFRARFEGREPRPDERYWRVYTLSRFDGERWSRLTPVELARALGRAEERLAVPATRSPFADGAPTRFRAELLLEADSRPWRPSLGAPLASDVRQRYLTDGTLEGLEPLAGRSLLRLASSGEAPAHADPAGPAWYTWLPEGTNPRSRALARRLWQAAGGDPQAYLAALMARFGEAPFRYTLAPPRLTGRDRVDEFLFESRAGYCTHYASATAVMARVVGIPTRIVVGFLGGERHPDGHYTVRDHDAHAWTEVWLDGAWRRLDPTAAIAPERIEEGPQAVNDADQAYLANAPFSPLRLREVSWLNRARLEWERLEYRWQRGVVGYQQQRREAVLARLQQWWGEAWEALASGARGPLLLALLVGLSGILVLALRRGWPRFRARRHEAWLMRRLQAWLARHGQEALPGESPAAHLRRVAAQGLAPAPLDEAARAYERLAYARLSEAERQQRRDQLARACRRIRHQWPRH